MPQIDYRNIVNHYFTPEQQDGVSVFIKNHEGRYLYVNQHARFFLQTAMGDYSADLLGLRDEDIFSKQDEVKEISIHDNIARDNDALIKQVVSLTLKDGRVSKPVAYKRYIRNSEQNLLIGILIQRNFFKVNGRAVVLSNREMLILAFWVFGISAKTTAKRLHLSPSSIATYISRLRVKLDGLCKDKAIISISPFLVQELHRLLLSCLA